MLNQDKLFSLNHRVVFYIPSTSNKTQKISAKKHTVRTNEIANKMTGYFGGATIEKALGFYKAENGEYITEKINKVISFCDEKSLSDQSQSLLNLAHSKCKEWTQESIAVEIDSKLFFVD